MRTVVPCRLDVDKIRSNAKLERSTVDQVSTTTGKYVLTDILGVAHDKCAVGAAKLTALLKGIGPKILLVEEAGQVLEAHVLGSLVPSIQHMILIGDPLQLRPTLSNYCMLSPV